MSASNTQPKRRASDVVDSALALRRRGKYSLVVASICVLFPVWFIGSQIKELLAPSTNIYEDTSFVNLTKNNLQWDVYYGKSPMCGAMECHLTKDYPNENYLKPMVLPAQEFPLVGYKPGQMIYLRTTLKIPQELLQSENPIALHSLYVWAKKYEFFLNGIQIDEGSAETLNLTIPRRLVPDDGIVNLALKIDPGPLPYQGLANRKDLLIGDRAALKSTAFKPRELQTTYFLWFLLPRLTFCFIFAFLYLFLAQNRELFSFILYILVSSVAILLESAYAESLQNFGINLGIAAASVQSFTDLFLMLFIHDFFRMKTRKFFKWFQIALFTQILILTISSMTLPSKLVVNIAFVITVLWRTFAVFGGIYASIHTINLLQANKKSPTRIVTSKILLGVFLVALIPMVLENRRLISDILNIPVSGFPWTYAFDLIVFAVLASITAFDYGNTANARVRAERDLKVIEDRLELGRSVQNMLFPNSKTGKNGQLQFEFFFESAQTMAGDWYYTWQQPNGSTALFIGDVTGKGPQAAVAVAAIVSALANHHEANDSIETTITALNRHLYKLFSGKVMSTMSVTVIDSRDDHAQIYLYNCGTPGWLYKESEESRTRYLPQQSQQIGTQEEVRYGQKSVTIQSGGYIATYTDGCIDGSRGIKKYIELADQNPAELSPKLIYETMIEAGKQTVQSDDRTALVITHA